MIGPKNLSVIREDIQRALANEAGDDPIVWLEGRMNSAKVGPAERDVLQSLSRFLADLGPKKQKQRKRAE